jgi:cell division protein ZapA
MLMGFIILQGYRRLSAPRSEILGAPMKSGIKVEVYGYTFNVKSELGSEQIQDIADFVDEKMKDLATKLRVASTSRLAIMAALNIAEEYYRLKSEQNALNKAIDEKSAELIQLVDESII